MISLLSNSELILYNIVLALKTSQMIFAGKIRSGNLGKIFFSADNNLKTQRACRLRSRIKLYWSDTFSNNNYETESSWCIKLRSLVITSKLVCKPIFGETSSKRKQL